MGSLRASSNRSHSSSASSAPPRFPASTTVSPRFGVRRCCAFVGIHRRHDAWVHRNEALDQNKPNVTQARVAGGTDLACCRRQESMQHRVVPSPERDQVTKPLLHRTHVREASSANERVSSYAPGAPSRVREGALLTKHFRERLVASSQLWCEHGQA